MRRWETILPHWRVLVVLAIVDAALILGSASLPDLPGDVALARLIQSVAPIPVGLAQWITATADKPGCFVLLGLTFFVAWLMSGWRAAMVSLAVFFGLWFFGIWLSPIAAQPRPSPDLINVVGHPKGYAFPSIFGLVYVATFGYLGILGASEYGTSTASGALMLVAAVVILAIGAIARIDLGAHWPSDLWVAYLIGLWWILLLLPFARRPRIP
jgi:membrane-associated phospholipid phosphatase